MMNQHYRSLIADEFRNCVRNTMHRMQGSDTYRPFHSALLPEEAIFWSRFERSFSTSFGQRVIEEIARIVVLANGAQAAERQRETYVTLDNAYFSSVSAHIERLRSGMHLAPHDWETSFREVVYVPSTGESRTVRIISDLWWTKDGVNNYISLKTVKPNIDQTAFAKQDCLLLKIADSACNVYFGLPYNPYGEKREDYRHNPPMGIFDIYRDSVVLIGRDLWDTLGGYGCYEEVLDIASDVGRETRWMIQNGMTR